MLEGDRMVDVAPPDLPGRRRLADDELVLRRAAGVLAGPDDERALRGDHALAGADGVLVQLGGGEVRPDDAADGRGAIGPARVVGRGGTGGGLGHRLDSSGAQAIAIRSTGRAWLVPVAPEAPDREEVGFHSRCCSHPTATRPQPVRNPEVPGRCIRMSGRPAVTVPTGGAGHRPVTGAREPVLSPSRAPGSSPGARGPGRAAQPASSASAGPRSGRRRPRSRPTGGRAPDRPRAASPATEAWVIVAGISTSDSTPPSDSARVKSRVDSAIATARSAADRPSRHGGMNETIPPPARICRPLPTRSPAGWACGPSARPG